MACCLLLGVGVVDSRLKTASSGRMSLVSLKRPGKEGEGPLRDFAWQFLQRERGNTASFEVSGKSGA